MIVTNVVPMTANATNSNLIETNTTASFSRTLEMLVEAIHSAGMKVFATIDHAACAAGSLRCRRRENCTPRRG